MVPVARICGRSLLSFNRHLALSTAHYFVQQTVAELNVTTSFVERPRKTLRARIIYLSLLSITQANMYRLPMTIET